MSRTGFSSVDHLKIPITKWDNFFRRDLLTGLSLCRRFLGTGGIFLDDLVHPAYGPVDLINPLGLFRGGCGYLSHQTGHFFSAHGHLFKGFIGFAVVYLRFYLNYRSNNEKLKGNDATICLIRK
jgi:hypothetical protein